MTRSKRPGSRQAEPHRGLRYVNPHLERYVITLLAAVNCHCEMRTAKGAGTSSVSALGGERQRVAIARALANDPTVLLADEPTGSLDSASVDVVLALFQRLRRDRATTIVLVTHDEAVAAGADRVVHMVDGRVVADGAAVPGATELRPARPDVLWPGVSAMIRR